MNVQLYLEKRGFPIQLLDTIEDFLDSSVINTNTLKFRFTSNKGKKGLVKMVVNSGLLGQYLQVFLVIRLLS